MSKQDFSLPACLIAGFVVWLAGVHTATAQVDKGTLWRDAVVTVLDVDFGDTGFHARWTFHRCECGDLQVQVEQTAPDGVVTGELLLVDGQVLLSRGFEQQNGDNEALIQAPSLMLQLTHALLNRSQPKGPHAVHEKQQWDVTEKHVDFKLDTGLASGAFAAPWGVKGAGWMTGSGHHRFELLFEFSDATPGQTASTGSMTFSGELDFGEQLFPFSESTDLEGWRIQWISRDERESKPTPKGLTLQSLRQQIKDP